MNSVWTLRFFSLALHYDIILNNFSTSTLRRYQIYEVPDSRYFKMCVCVCVRACACVCGGRWGVGGMRLRIEEILYITVLFSRVIFS